jgi:hypothetical protein
MKKIIKLLSVILSITILSLPLTISAVETRVLLEETPFQGVGKVVANSSVYFIPAEGCTLSEEDFPDFNFEGRSYDFERGAYHIRFSTFNEAFSFIDTVATNEKIVKAEISRRYQSMLYDVSAVRFEGNEFILDGYWDYDEETGRQYISMPEDVEITRVTLPDIREIIAAEQAALETITYGDIDDDSKFANITDIVLLGKHLSGKITLPEDTQNYKNANCDLTDDAVNIDDLRAMIDFMTGAIDSLPVTE